MATTWRFYHDAAGTQEITALNPLTATQGAGLGAVLKTVYLMSVASGLKTQAVSNPGVDAVVVSIVDADAGTGAPATECKLGISPAARDAATAGAALTLSATLNSGVGNAIPIYTRRVSALTVVGNYSDISLTTNAINDSPI